MRKFLFGILLSLNVLPQAAVAQDLVPDPAAAMNTPSKHAWDLFVALNHPALSPETVRGIPDPSKVIGDTGAVVWETWKSAGSEVFLPDGSRPLPWEDMSTENAPSRGKTFEAPKSAILDAFHRGQSLESILTDMKIMGVEEDGVFGQGGGETRMNKDTFDFIVNNGLYNIDGQERLFTEVTSKQRQQLSFPVGSIEVKAMWIPLKDDDFKPGGKASRYHVSKDTAGRSYGLVALHVITKEVPKWFWATFAQVDGPDPLIPPVDDYGRPAKLNGTKWQYYELSGTQTDFVDTFGRSIRLSDPHVESGFELSSCISCHAMASIGAPSTQTFGDRLAFFNIGQPGDGGTPLGVPPWAMFFESDEQTARYIQLDFVMSMHFRARRELK